MKGKSSMSKTNVAVISNAATERWLDALKASRDAFEAQGLPRFRGSPDCQIYDVPEISSAASKIVSRQAPREDGKALQYQIYTHRMQEDDEKVVVEWY